MAERRPVSYGDAGVDLEAAERSVGLIGARVAATHGPEVLGGIGGFGGLFRFDPSAWRDPVLVSSSDGVGTKVELARQLDRLDGIGHDLVGMVVDDLVAVGARPLFMNDYLAVGRLDPERVADLVGGIADACGLAGCALVGGETAEHPGLLEPDAFDVAGFAVGVVERDALLGPDRVRDGDVLIALPSSGPHANGYSLIRRIVDGLDLAEHHGLERPLGDELMEPTRVHTPDVLAVIDALGVGEDGVHAACHVTGGGLPGNLPRVLPDGLAAVVDRRRGTGRRCSAGSPSTDPSRTPRCGARSTAGSAWCWSSHPTRSSGRSRCSRPVACRPGCSGTSRRRPARSASADQHAARTGGALGPRRRGSVSPSPPRPLAQEAWLRTWSVPRPNAQDPTDVPRADPAAPVILDGLASQHADADPVETGEWLDAFDAVVDQGGPARARFLMLKVLERARQRRSACRR
jgi:phosphoribosylformylglycinamidine cyclo-ligase